MRIKQLKSFNCTHANIIHNIQATYTIYLFQNTQIVIPTLNYRSKLLFIMATLAQNVAAPDWTTGIMPKTDTQAQAFIEKYTSCDGRGVVVGILDTGVDPGAAGLQVTSDGRAKVIDLVDATGSGDVDMSTVKTVNLQEKSTVVGKTGRTLKLSSDWSIPDGKIRMGMKRGYDIYPRGLKRRVEKERKKVWDEKCRTQVNTAQRETDDFEALNKGSKDEAIKKRIAEMKERVTQLEALSAKYEDFGPVFDCVVFHDGSCWRAAVDVDGSGDLTKVPLLTNFRAERQYSTFSIDDAVLNFACNIYDNGNVLSIVNDAGAHGTHVSGIVAANYPDSPEVNGIAPGAQIVGIRIGDTHLGSMETGTGLIRGLIAVLENKCDVVNMSYGEPAKSLNSGTFCKFANELVNKHNVIFVASAGNAGPALSSVGAPGGTTTGIISVGAYVSPHMMAAEYQLREVQGAKNYTWSSRGPAFDGDYGVSVSAPGGAITCVPTWTLQRNQLMNGTSMSSPNCAGNVALLLSALKQNGTSYSPARIRRALENSAKPIPNNGTILDSGRGLVQIDDAYEYVMAQKQKVYEDVNFELSPRGIYLRQPHQVSQPYVSSVSVNPIFHEDSLKRNLIDFEMRVDLKASARWVSVASHMVLMHGGRGFEVRVDPTGLSAGVHFAEISGYDSASPSSGPVFRVPITVVVPEKLGSNGVTGSLGEVRLESGSIERRFVAVPAGAQWVDIVISGSNAFANSRIYMLHLQQVVKQYAHRDVSFKKSFRMVSTDRVGYSCKVYPGHTLEVCLAQYWSSLGNSNVVIDVTFRGVSPSQQELVFPSGENISRVDLAANLNQVSLKPSGKFTKWREILRPISSKIVAGLNERDLMPNDRLIYKLVLEYSFNQEDSGKINVRAPRLNDLLYESNFGSQFYYVYDENKRLVGTGDAFEETITAPKGKNTIQFNIRHASTKKLKDFQDMILLIERSLGKNVSLTAHRSLAGASSGEDLVRTVKVSKGTVFPVFVSVPSNMNVPKGSKPGDTLVGSITYLDGSASKAFVGDGTFPGGYAIKAVIPKKTKPDKKNNSDEDSKEKSMQTKLASWYLDEAKTKVGKDGFADAAAQVETAVGKIDAASEKYSAVLLKTQYLQMLLSHESNSFTADKFIPSKAHGEDQLNKIVSAADAILSAIDTDKIKLSLGANVATDDKDGKREREHREALKGILVDALHRKLHAAISAGNSSLVDETWKEMERWVVKMSKYAVLNYRREVHSERYGHALKHLLAMLGGVKDSGGAFPSKFVLWKELSSICNKLGWKSWEDYARISLASRFPGKM